MFDHIIARFNGFASLTAGVLITLLIPIGIVQNQKSIMQNQDKISIEATLRAYGSALNASDAKAAVAAYTSDGVFMPTGGPTATGTEELLGSYTFIFTQIRLDVEFDIHEVVVDGDLAYAVTSSQGQQTILATNSTGPEANRELFVLRREGAEWKIARYMFNKVS
ncbi:SgcJ/EcaC family oxidoreductase [bacterium]|nr:SgcJ/EcaC family oxidoreductase [bacterium]